AQAKLHTLTAPISGRVGRAQVVRGQTLAVGTPVAEVIDLDESIDVVCYVPPGMVGRLKTGQPARSGGFDPDPAAPPGPEAAGKEETTGVARRLNVVLGVRDRTLHQVEIVALEDPEKDPAKKWKGDPKDALFVVEGGQGLQTGDAVKLEVEGD